MVSSAGISDAIIGDAASSCRFAWDGPRVGEFADIITFLFVYLLLGMGGVVDVVIQ